MMPTPTPSPFTISHISPEDVPFMREMLYQSIFVHPPPPRTIIDEPEFKHYVAGWGKPDDAGWIAKDAQANPIGAGWLRLLRHDDPGYGFVDDATPEVCTLAVVPEWRGKGVGTALMTALLIHVDAHYSQVALSCNPQNQAMRLYGRLGFVYHGISGTSHTLVRTNLHRRTTETIARTKAQANGDERQGNNNEAP